MRYRRFNNYGIFITLNTTLSTKADSEHKHTMTDIEDYKMALLDFLYPVGSVYKSMKYTSPAAFLGGRWKKIEDRFLFRVSDKTMLETGGSKTIMVENLPVHTHELEYKYEIAKDRNGNPDGATDSGSSKYYWRYGTEFVEANA